MLGTILHLWSHLENLSLGDQEKPLRVLASFWSMNYWRIHNLQPVSWRRLIPNWWKMPQNGQYSTGWRKNSASPHSNLFRNHCWPRQWGRRDLLLPTNIRFELKSSGVRCFSAMKALSGASDHSLEGSHNHRILTTMCLSIRKKMWNIQCDGLGSI